MLPPSGFHQTSGVNPSRLPPASKRLLLLSGFSLFYRLTLFDVLRSPRLRIFLNLPSEPNERRIETASLFQKRYRRLSFRRIHLTSGFILSASLHDLFNLSTYKIFRPAETLPKQLFLFDLTTSDDSQFLKLRNKLMGNFLPSR
jgi:hypothetical protein